jgi:hypothetical protein
MEFWDNWPKPWGRDQCRDRYVRGSEISYPQLSKASGVPQGTINRWAKGNSGKSWKVQRQEFLLREQSETDQKTITSRSDLKGAIASAHETAQAEAIEELNITLKDLTKEHFESYREVRNTAAFMLSNYSRMVRELTDPDLDLSALHPDIALEVQKKRLEYMVDPAKFMKTISLNALTAIAQIIDLCVRGERVSTGAEYEDINKAIRLIKRCGLEVNVPKDADLIKLSTGQATHGASTPSAEVVSAPE